MTAPLSPPAKVRLNAFFAAVNRLDAGARACAVRRYLERGLGRMQALEQRHYALLAECALLATDNVQDVRLFDLEQRVAAVENPSEAFGSTLVGIAVNVALQVAVLSALDGVAAAVLAYMGSGVAAAAMREALAEFRPATLSPGDLLAYDEACNSERAALVAAQNLRSIADNVARGDIPPGGYLVALDVGGSETLSVENLAQWNRVMQTVIDRQASLAAELALRDQAIAESKASAVAAFKAAQQKTDSDLAEVKAWSQTWRDFLGDERGGLVLTPAYMLFDAARSKLLAAEASTAQPRLPVTSEITGRLLDWASERQLEVADDYAALRLHVRYSSDADLKADPRCTALAQLVTELLPQFERLRALGQAARALITTGFEAAIWLFLLRANGYLEVKPNTFYFAYVASQAGEYELGHVLSNEPTAGRPDVDGGLARSFGRPWLTDYYVGVGQMTEVQAEYLYHRYAKAWFAMDENVTAAKLPFEYHAEEYDSLASDPPSVWAGLVPYTAREQRVAKLKLLVIKYFTLLPQQPVSSDLKTFLGDGLQQQVRDYLSGLPNPTVPDPTDSAEATLQALDDAKAPLQSLYAAAGVAPETDFKLAALDFGDELAHVEADIDRYQLLEAGAAEVLGTTDDPETADLLQSIDMQRQNLGPDYDALVQMAGTDADELEWLQARYAERKDAALAWQAPATWQFYPPDRGDSAPR